MVCVSESARRRLHEQFLVATKRPVFRKANSYQFVDKQSCSGTCITDVHYGLNSSTGEILVQWYHITYCLHRVLLIFTGNILELRDLLDFDFQATFMGILLSSVTVGGI